MIEAVGREFLPTYIKQLDVLLKKGGKVLIQAITMKDENYEEYCQNTDFIRHYIFPGSHLVSIENLKSQFQKNTELKWTGEMNYALDYARTLADWNHIYQMNRPTYHHPGFDDKFYRLWEYYFCYCEAGFRGRLHRTYTSSR